MSKKRSNKPEMPNVNVFRCDKCEAAGEMSVDDFKEHLLTVHQTSADQIKGTKQMIMHLDGARWYSSTYKWTLENGLTFHQYIQNKRDKNSYMY